MKKLILPAIALMVSIQTAFAEECAPTKYEVRPNSGLMQHEEYSALTNREKVTYVKGSLDAWYSAQGIGASELCIKEMHNCLKATTVQAIVDDVDGRLSIIGTQVPINVVVSGSIRYLCKLNAGD